MMALAAAAPAFAVHRSRKLIPEFRLHRPQTPAEAAAIKASAGPGAVFMAGGVDIVNRMKFGAPVRDLVHLGKVASLDGIAEDADGLRLGALVTHDQVAQSPLVRRRLPALAETWPGIANIRIRCKGTLGGNIMAGDPAYDFALAAMAAGALLQFVRPDGGVDVASAAEPGIAQREDLLTAITLPCARRLRLRFDRSLRPIVSIALGLDLADGLITDGRVAIGCAYRGPLAAKLPLGSAVMLRDLAGHAERLAQALVSDLPEPVADHHASADYRRRMVGVLLRRNLAAIR